MASTKKLSTLTIDLQALTNQHDAKINKARGELRQYATQAKAANDATYKMAGGFTTAANQASVMYGPLNGLSGRLSSVAAGLRMMGPAGFVAAGGISGFTAVLTSAVSEAAKMESLQLKTQALLRSTGYAAGFTGAALDENAKSVAKATLASIEQIRAAQDVLLTFKGVQGPIFKEAISLSQDLAAVMGGDAKSAALQLGKALEDPKTGLNALKRAGVSFTETEKDMIVEMVEAGRTADAQREILKKLHEQIGGSGEGEAQGIIGSVDTFAQSWQELLIQMGKTSGIAPYVSDALLRMSRGMDVVRDAMKPDDSEDLFTKRLALVEQLAEKKQELKDLGYQDDLVLDQISVLEKAIAKLDKPLALELEGDQSGIDEGLKAYQGMLAKQKQMEEEAAAARDALRKEQEAKAREEANKRYAALASRGAATISQLDLQYASEQEKLRLNLEKQLQQIETMQLSKAELERRGYDSMAALRAEYENKAREDYQRKSQELQSREVETLRNGLVAKDQLELESYTNRQQRLYNFWQESLITQEEFQNLSAASYAQYQESINQEIQRRMESLRTSLMTEVESIQAEADKRMTLLDAARDRDLVGHQEYLKLKARIEEQYSKKMRAYTDAQATASAQAYSALFGNISDLAKGFAGEQSGIYKAMFAASKAFAVAESIVKIQQGIAAAAAHPWPANIAAIGSVISATSGIVATIKGTQMKGMAHSGIDYIPQEGTWLLDKGERVLSPRQNADLTQFMQKGGGGFSGNIIINNNGEPVTGTASMDNEGNILILLERADEHIANGIYQGTGQTSRAIEGVLGGNRARSTTR